MFRPKSYLNLNESEHQGLFSDCRYVWDALKRLPDYFQRWKDFNNCATLKGESYIEENVDIGEGTIVEHGAVILGPVVIGKNCLIRSGAYIRDHSVIGNNCIIGKSVELKYAILFNGCQVPHFNYVGDSVLGHKVHLGAGVKISNYKLMPSTIKIDYEGERIDTGLLKFGAVLADHSEVGCNTVLNPGSLIGRRSVVYPNVFWRGVLDQDQIVKNHSKITITARRKDKV